MGTGERRAKVHIDMLPWCIFADVWDEGRWLSMCVSSLFFHGYFMLFQMFFPICTTCIYLLILNHWLITVKRKVHPHDFRRWGWLRCFVKNSLSTAVLNLDPPDFRNSKWINQRTLSPMSWLKIPFTCPRYLWWTLVYQHFFFIWVEVKWKRQIDR